MTSSIHLTEARKIMQRPESFSLTVLASDGRVIEIKECVSLKWDFRTGTRTLKLIPSGQIRRIRDTLIIGLNSLTVYL